MTASFQFCLICSVLFCSFKSFIYWCVFAHCCFWCWSLFSLIVDDIWYLNDVRSIQMAYEVKRLNLSMYIIWDRFWNERIINYQILCIRAIILQPESNKREKREQIDKKFSSQLPKANLNIANNRPTTGAWNQSANEDKTYFNSAALNLQIKIVSCVFLSNLSIWLRLLLLSTMVLVWCDGFVLFLSPSPCFCFSLFEDQPSKKEAIIRTRLTLGTAVVFSSSVLFVCVMRST